MCVALSYTVAQLHSMGCKYTFTLQMVISGGQQDKECSERGLNTTGFSSDGTESLPAGGGKMRLAQQEDFLTQGHLDLCPVGNFF